MKRIITYIILILTFMSLGFIGLLNKDKKIEEVPPKEILDNTYYRYNYITDSYETLTIKAKEFTYIGDIIDLSSCDNYTYSNNEFKFSCGTNIKLGATSDIGLILKINENNYFFYKDTADSYKKEFSTYFNVDLDTYKNEGLNRLSQIEITKEEIPSSKFVYTYKNECNNTCVILNNNLKTLSNEIKYLDYNKLTKEDIDSINELFIDKNNTLETLNYPVILVIKDNQITDVLELEIEGFDTSKYNNVLKEYEE